MPPNPISSMMTLVIPLFFALALATAPPVGAGPSAMGEPLVWSAGDVVRGPLASHAETVPGGPLASNADAVPPTSSIDPVAGGPLTSSAAAMPAAWSTDAAARALPPADTETVPGGPLASNADAVPPTSSAWGAAPASNAEGVVGACTGSFCELVRPAPLRLSPTGQGDGGLLGRGPGLLDGAGFGAAEPLFPMTPLDPEFCEYVGPAPFFMSPSDSEFCGLVSPAPLSLPSVTV